MAASAAALAQRSGAIDEIVEPYVGSETPGIGVLVMNRGKVVHMAGYGLADIDSESPVDKDSIFDLASVSKQMTALAAMLLVQDGVIAPETPVHDLLPVLHSNEKGFRPITVLDLVHHVSGYPDYLSGDEELDYGGETTNAEVVDWLAGKPLDRAPGTAFDYSNTGYLVLASLVAAADGEDSLAAVLSKRIWRPLGMKSTSLAKPADPSHRVTGYAGTDGAFEESAWDTAVEGDGNVLTTLSDLARYEAALANGKLLGKEATAALFVNGTLDDGTPIDDGEGNGDGYGWGWGLEGDGVASHGGSWMGTSTFYRRDLATGITVIVLANGEDMDTGALAAEIAAAVK